MSLGSGATTLVHCHVVKFLQRLGTSMTVLTLQHDGVWLSNMYSCWTIGNVAQESNYHSVPMLYSDVSKMIGYQYRSPYLTQLWRLRNTYVHMAQWITWYVARQWSSLRCTYHIFTLPCCELSTMGGYQYKSSHFTPRWWYLFGLHTYYRDILWCLYNDRVPI